jgi:hypothetical protein
MKIYVELSVILFDDVTIHCAAEKQKKEISKGKEISFKMAMQVSWFLKEEISRMIAETALCGAVI